jgi:hypothetical protein
MLYNLEWMEVHVHFSSQPDLKQESHVHMYVAFLLYLFELSNIKAGQIPADHIKGMMYGHCASTLTVCTQVDAPAK